MWRTRLLNIVVVLSLAATRMASAQPSADLGKNFHKIITLDSIQFQGLGASPDGRWLTIAAEHGIWIMPADGRAKPTRLLSNGYVDRSPVWFPSSDRLAFVSNRASRDGSERLYAMTVVIDPKTGRATSPPRQIGTEETPLVGAVSPDGKWVTYPSPIEKAWKAVPSTGGASRTLVKNPELATSLMWSRDGKTVYFAVGSRSIQQPPYGIWYKVGASGGRATRAYQNADAMPYPSQYRHARGIRSPRRCRRRRHQAR